MLNKKTRARERKREMIVFFVQWMLFLFARPLQFLFGVLYRLATIVCHSRRQQPAPPSKTETRKEDKKKSCEFLKSELVMAMGTNHARPVGEFLYCQFHSILCSIPLKFQFVLLPRCCCLLSKFAVYVVQWPSQKYKVGYARNDNSSVTRTNNDWSGHSRNEVEKKNEFNFATYTHSRRMD